MKLKTGIIALVVTIGVLNLILEKRDNNFSSIVNLNYITAQAQESTEHCSSTNHCYMDEVTLYSIGGIPYCCMKYQRNECGYREY